MKPLPFVWPYALVFWGVYVWAFLSEWKVVRGGVEGTKSADSKDSGSLRVLLGGTWIALFLAFPLSFVRTWSFARSAQLPLFAVGVALVLLGSLLRRYCWRTLGQYFTGDVRARLDQPVDSHRSVPLLYEGKKAVHSLHRVAGVGKADADLSAAATVSPALANVPAAGGLQPNGRCCT